MTKSIKKSIIYICILLLGGCTMKYSFTGASISPETKTVSIVKFENMTPFNPLLSSELTEALKDRFMSETNLIIISDTKGDLHFEGKITQYGTRPVAIQADSDLAQQNRLSITIKVKFVNSKDPKNNYESSFTRYADYDSNLGLDAIESQLTTEIIEELVDDIFNKAVINW